MTYFEKWEALLNSPLLKIKSESNSRTCPLPISIDDLYEIIHVFGREYHVSFPELYHSLFVTSGASYKVCPHDVHYDTLDELYHMIKNGEIPSIHVWTPRSPHTMKSHTDKLSLFFNKAGFGSRVCFRQNSLREDLKIIALNSTHGDNNIINKIKLHGIDVSLFYIDIGFIIHEDFNTLITSNGISREFLKYQVLQLSKVPPRS